MPATANLLDTLRRGVAQHVVFCGLTLFALGAQFVYRIPSRVMAVWLAWIGVVLLGLGLVVVINRVLAQPPSDSTILTRAERWSMMGSLALLGVALLAPHGIVSHLLRLVVWFALATVVLTVLVLAVRLVAPMLGPRTRRALRALERGLTLIVGGFILVGVLVFVNGYRDSSAAVESPSEVIALGGGEVELLGTTLFSWADLRSWRRPGTVERVFLHPDERALTWVGLPVVVRIRPGAFGIGWVESVVRDREQYYRQVLTIAPNAAGPRRERLLWLVEHLRWDDTVEAAREYVRLYPDDYDFIKGIAASLAVVGRVAEEVALLEPFMGRQPKNYELLNLVGWGMHQSGQTARGIRILEDAVVLEPDNWMAYYHLGYAYRAAGRPSQAIVAFEKVLELRRSYPEIERELEMLRRRVMGASTMSMPNTSASLSAASRFAVPLRRRDTARDVAELISSAWST